MMRFRPLNTCLISMCFLIYSSALPRAKDYRPLSAEYGSSTGTDVASGSSNPANIGPYNKEPTCEELRAMWRFSKRQSRAAEITNEIPTYRDPFAFNVWDDYSARPRSAARGYARYRKPPVYGRVVHTTPYLRTPENFPERVRAFEEVARLFGTANHPSTVPSRKTLFRFGGGTAPMPNMQMHPSQAGSFQHLKELIRNERARELQEQRLSEQSDRNLLKDHSGRYNRLEGNSAIPVEDNVSAERSGLPNKGIVAFPDILVPASYKYINDYAYPSQLTMHKYKQRYPDNSIMGGEREWAW